MARRAFHIAFITALFTLVLVTAAQARCWDTGRSIRCPPGCELVKPPHFPGDIFTWRCRQPPPPPPRYSYTLPPDSCPSGMYAATDTWCCPFGTVYRNGDCFSAQEPGTYQASGPEDPTPFLMILSVIALGIFAWYDHHTRQVAYAREAADVLDSTDDIAAATNRMQEAADEADEILRRFREEMSGDEP